MAEGDFQNLYPRVKPIAPRRPVTLLLGTDRHINEDTPDEQETRVGISPRQARSLKTFLERAGVPVRLLVVQDAGAAAGYPDSAYEEAGCCIVQEHLLASLPSPPDVFHALKEPCAYEATIPGPFVRIGALHTGEEFRSNGDLANLLRRQNYCAIFDGSALGGFAYKLRGGHEIPLRSSMSVFAGRIAADIVGERLAEFDGQGAVTISGGGVVGTSAVERLLSRYRESVSRITLVEALEGKYKQLMRTYAGVEAVRIVNHDVVEDEHLDGAAGLILGAARRAMTAPYVVQLPQLARMRRGGIVVDVSIDEGGSIPGLSGLSEEEIASKLPNDIQLVADTHLPKKHPHAASEAHGKAVLPYLGVLLYLCAREGGPVEATRYVWRFELDDCDKVTNHFDALVCDLRNGLAFANFNRQIILFEEAVRRQESIIDTLAGEGYSCVWGSNRTFLQASGT